jgi:hypothetical protein
MPDVGLFTATEPLSKDMKVVIKYSVEVEGLPVYSETYDVDTLAKELKKDEAKSIEIWSRRIKCVAACREPSRIQLVPYAMPLGWECLRLRASGLRASLRSVFTRAWAKSASVSRAGRIHLARTLLPERLATTPRTRIRRAPGEFDRDQWFVLFTSAPGKLPRLV